MSTKLFKCTIKTCSKCVLKDSECIILVLNLEDRDSFLNLPEWFDIIKESCYIRKIFVIGNAPEKSTKICTAEMEILDFLSKVKSKYKMDNYYSQIDVNDTHKTLEFIKLIFQYCGQEELRKMKNNDESISRGCIIA